MSGAPLRIAGSILDRLLDLGSEERGLSLREAHAGVMRDLEALLNARRPWASVPERFAPLRGSILGYGLPDFTAGSFNAPAQREALCRDIAAAIRRFEPRLTQVSVRQRNPSDTMVPILRMRIEAVLRSPAGDEPIAFDTALDTTTTDLVVRPDADV